MRREVKLAAILLPALLAMASARAEQPQVTPEPASRWTLGASYLADGFVVVDGGLQRGSRLLDKLDLYAGWRSDTTDTPRTQAYLALQHVNGQSISGDFIGDFQAVDNLEATAAWRVAEAWVEQTFAEQRAGLRFGLIDLNTQFDIQELGGLFLNSSHGIGPELSQTGLTGPSIFPITGLGLTAHRTFAAGWTLRGGVFDGAPGDPRNSRRTTIRLSSREGALLIAEAEHRWQNSARMYVGTWGYTAAFAGLEVGESDAVVKRRNNRGSYALLEGPLWRADEARVLKGWLRAGYANARLNPVRRYLGGGLVVTAPFGAEDELGIAFARAEFGDLARRLEDLEVAETAIELTYRWPITATLALQPDLQYVRNPGGNPELRDALVIGIRFSWTLEANP